MAIKKKSKVNTLFNLESNQIDKQHKDNYGKMSIKVPTKGTNLLLMTKLNAKQKNKRWNKIGEDK